MKSNHIRIDSNLYKIIKKTVKKKPEYNGKERRYIEKAVWEKLERE